MSFSKLERELRQLGSDNVAIARGVLKANGKVASAETSASVDYEIRIFPTGIEIELTAGESWKFINDGRPAGSKLPPSIKTRKGRKLALWFDIKNIPESADYPVRLSIAKKGIEAIDITQQVLDRIIRANEERISEAAYLDLHEFGFDKFNRIVKGTRR